MASKHKARPKVSVEQRVAIIERELARGQVKQALKDARGAYREQPTPELRVLFERASLARARELVRQNLHPQARDVAQQLLSQEVTDSSVRNELPGVLAVLGLLGENQRLFEQTPDAAARAGLLQAAADAAVLHAAAEGSLPAEVRTEVNAVRRALQLFEADREEDALATVKDIPRQSLLADWKLFLRGWAAFRRQEFTEAGANWQRLAPGRLASRAATLVQRVQEGAKPQKEDPPALALAVADMARELPGGMFATDLTRLQAEIAREDWKSAFLLVRQAKDGWRRFDPKLADRVTAVLYFQVVLFGDLGLLDRLANSAYPLPIDPHWNRARALVHGHPELGDLDEAASFWTRYVDDLESVTSMSPEERRLAQALVWLHVGRVYMTQVADLSEFGFGRQKTGALSDEQHQALRCFAESQRLAPTLRDAYQAVVDAYEEWDLSDQAAGAAEALLQRFPEDFRTLISLAAYYLDNDDPLAAREYIRRAHRLKPLDKGVSAKAWMIHVASARELALRGEWERGREEFAEAERFDGPADANRSLDVRRAMFELKAGDRAAHERWSAQAEESAGANKMALALAFAVEAHRYQLPRGEVNRYVNEWRTIAAASKVTTSDVAQVCDLIGSYRAAGVDYPGLKYDTADVVAIVRRAARKKFAAREHRSVCMLLRELPDEEKLFKQWVQKGRKAHPQEAYFAFMTGELEFERGPFQCRRKIAQGAFEEALSAAEKSDDPFDQALLETARERLSLLAEPPPLFAPPGFGGRHRSGMSSAAIDAMIDAVCDEMGISPAEFKRRFGKMGMGF